MIILITRPEPGATATARRVAKLGFMPLVASALTIVPILTALPPPQKIAAVLITSGNALAAAWPAFFDRPILTVGDATAERARTMGFTQVLSASGDATALAAMVAARRGKYRGTLLLLSGRGQGAALAKTLRGAGFPVIRRVAYETRPVAVLAPEAAAALRAGDVRAALFFSAETACVFVRLVQSAGLTEAVRNTDALAIGAPACVALQALPWRRIGVASSPNQDALLALIE